MRQLLFRLGHAATNGGAEFGELYGFIGRRDPNCVGRFFQEGFDIGFDDAPTGAAAADGAQIEGVFGGHAASYGGGFDAAGELRTHYGGIRRGGLRAGFSFGSGRRVFGLLHATGQCSYIHTFTGLAYHADRRAHGQHIPLIDEMFQHNPRKGRFDLYSGFIGLNFGQNIAAFNFAALGNHPTHQHAFGHIKAQFGHGNKFGH